MKIVFHGLPLNNSLFSCKMIFSILMSNLILDIFVPEEKLKKCKECFERSYGQNLERLTVVRVIVNWIIVDNSNFSFKYVASNNIPLVLNMDPPLRYLK